MIKKQLFILGVAVALLVVSRSIDASAAPVDDYEFGSQGDIIYTNDTPDTSDDVIFHASDIYNLAKKCQ